MKSKSGLRPQCKKPLTGVQPESGRGPAVCNMPLNSKGECPDHGKNIK